LTAHVYCFCGDIPLFAKLRDCKRDASEGTVEALQKIVPAIRQRFGSKVRIIVRADSGLVDQNFAPIGSLSDVGAMVGPVTIEQH
jgi:hypothetical protein